MSRTDRVSFSRPALPARWRLFIVVGCALAGVLAAFYLSIERQRVLVSYQLVGQPLVACGRTAAFRVIAYERDKRAYPIVQLLGARFVGGRAANGLGVSADGVGGPLLVHGRPAVATLPVPSGCGPLLFELDLKDADGEVRTLRADVRALEPTAAGTGDTSVADPGGFVAEGELAPMLVPEEGAIVRGMPNRVFVRVLSSTGEPVAATVDVRFGRPSLDPQHVVQTSACGLGVFELESNQPDYAFRLEARSSDGRRGAARQRFRPLPRDTTLRIEPPVAAPNAPIDIRVRSLRDGEAVYCDVRRGPLVLAACDGRVVAGEFGFALRAPRDVGLYTVQCMQDMREPGQAFAVRGLLVAEGAALPALLAGSAASSASALPDPQTAWSRALPSHDAALIRDYLLARLPVTVLRPETLAATRPGDESALAARRAGQRLALLAGVTALLGLLCGWAVLRVFRHWFSAHRQVDEALRESDREAEAGAAEPGAATAAPSSAPPAVRRTGPWRFEALLAVVATLAAFIAALVWLLATIVQ